LTERGREIKDQSHSCPGAINVDCKKQSRSSLAEGNFFNFEHPWKLSTNFSSSGFTATDCPLPSIRGPFAADTYPAAIQIKWKVHLCRSRSLVISRTVACALLTLYSAKKESQGTTLRTSDDWGLHVPLIAD